jgi:hypothetical protein
MPSLQATGQRLGSAEFGPFYLLIKLGPFYLLITKALAKEQRGGGGVAGGFEVKCGLNSALCTMYF